MLRKIVKWPLILLFYTWLICIAIPFGLLMMLGVWCVEVMEESV